MARVRLDVGHPFRRAGVLFAFERDTGGIGIRWRGASPISKGFALDVVGNINGSIDLRCRKNMGHLVCD